MKQTWKQLGSLFLAVYMVLTMLPTAAFAKTVDVDSGVPLGVSSIITEFAPLDEDVAEQTVEIGAAEDALNLPEELIVTVQTESTATDSGAQKETTQATVAVSVWTANPNYDGGTAENYIFTPVLDLPESMALAEGVTAPTITIVVGEAAARGAVLMLISSGNTIDLSDTNPLTSGTGWSYNSGAQVYTIANNADVIITGSNAGSERRVEVAADAIANITLDGASISGLGDNQSPLLLKSGAEVSLAAMGDNTLSAGGNCAGIQAPAGTTLTIVPVETLSLIVTGGTNGAGIGGGENEAGGNITINSDPVTAIGGANGAGIGGGANGAGGSVRLSGWVTAIGGTNGGAAIGGGSGSSSHGSLSFGSYTNFRYWTNTTNSDPGGTGTHNSATAFPEGSLDTFKFIRIEPEAAPSNIIDLSENYPSTSNIGWSYDSGAQVYTIANNADVIITGSNEFNQRRVEVAVSAKATITLDGASISGLGDGQSPLLLKNGAEVTLILEGDNTLRAGDNHAGIQAPAGTTLILGGEGSLSTTGGENGAGIGGANSAGGKITIGGTANVTATGGRSGAGIGGAIGAGGTITIGGNANVTATGGSAGAGIGGANNASSGGVNAAGGTITIGDNANVTVTGGYASAGIGGGQGGEGGNVRITGGTVKATHGGFACAIGAGNGSYAHGSLGFDSYTDFRYWTNTTNSDPVGDGTLHSVTPFPIASLKTFAYVKIAPGSAATVPSAPQSFTATPGDGQVVLSWDAPASNGNAEILRYEVSSNNGASWVTAAVDTSYTFTGLTNGTSYTFKVRAVNSAGNGIEASAITTPTAGGTPPTNAQTPSISEQPTSATYTQNDTAIELAVTASVVDGGILSYQWYSNTTNSTIGGTPITSSSINGYTPSTGTVGTTYYYCVVTNTNNEATTNKTATATSDAAAVTVNASGGTTSPIEITGFEAIPDENVGKAGSAICANVPEVINLLRAIHPYANAMHSGNQTALCLITGWEDTDGYNPNKAGSYTFTADVAILPGFANSSGHKVTVEVVVAPSDAPTITITKHPQNVTVTQGRINGTLTAEAVASNGKPIRYQWRQFIGGIGSDNTQPMLGETSNTFTIPTGLTAGTYQYLCTFNTDGTDYADSNTAIVTVNPPSGGSGNGGGSDSSGSGGGSYTPPSTTTPPQAPPTQPITATALVTATRGANGIANVNIPTSAIFDAITRAQAAARAQDSSANGISIGLNVTMPQGATSLTAEIPQSALQSLVMAGVSQFTVNGAPVSLGLNQNALRAIQSHANGGITIGMTPAAGLSASAQSMIGSRPVYNITISYTNKSGKTQNITSFGSGTATLAIPYTPGRNEAAGYLFGVYVDGKGNANRISGSVYDANIRSILIPTNHLSVYGVGYTAPSAKFTDVASHWAKDSIDYLVGRGLLSGTSETAFAPNTAMTRGMLVTALGRLAGLDTKEYTTNSFTDVNADCAFRPYIEWAYKKGVVQGIGNQQFAPDQAITREEIAVIFANFAKATGYKLPVTREATSYADASSIGSTYKTAVTAMQQAGIMMGGTDNKFSPKSNATRAEVSSMLHRYIKLTIDPATAQGWALNDAGQYLYYRDGKALTDTQTIDGVKYFFETNGVLKTGWVKDGDNWRYYSGNKAAMGWLEISDKRYYFTKDGLMVSGKWLEIDSKWYYINTDGSLAKSTKVDGYEIDENGVRKTK